MTTPPAIISRTNKSMANGYTDGYFYRYNPDYGTEEIKTLGFSGGSTVYGVASTGGITNFISVTPSTIPQGSQYSGSPELFILIGSDGTQAGQQNISTYNKVPGKGGYVGKVHKDAIDDMIESGNRFVARSNIFTELFGVNPS